MNFSFESITNITSISTENQPETFSHRPAAASSSIIGALSVQTVSFIFLGAGAAAPVIFIATVALISTLRSRRRPKHVLVEHGHRAREAWDDDADDNDGNNRGHKVSRSERHFRQELESASESGVNNNPRRQDTGWHAGETDSAAFHRPLEIPIETCRLHSNNS